MVALAGYEDFRQIYESVNSRVYRARRTSDKATSDFRERQPVILKFLNTDYPTPEQIRRYKQEYHLTFNLDAPGIIKAYSLEVWERSYAIALEDFGGISLQQWLEEKQRLEVGEFLPLAIAIAESLGQIHAQNIIHKDINPANIVLNPNTRELKIIDFGIATQLNRERPTLQNPNVLEGTLAYISPEQTGRMNRGLDYRTDFYSLGVTFYEMLAGQLPFTSDDPLELVHCHIAKTPLFPRQERISNNEITSIRSAPSSPLRRTDKTRQEDETAHPEREQAQQQLAVARDALRRLSSSASLTILDDEVQALRLSEAKLQQKSVTRVSLSPPLEIPPPIADIVMKLMAKNAEDRYQNADGLKADLEYCRQQFATTGKIHSFPLGDREISDRFQIPQKLYGREAEIAQLLATFDRVANPSPTLQTGHRGGELMLVAGYSGIGKSALVQELYKPITARRGYFIAGKFDQFQRNIPYSAIVSAFRGLVKQLLGERETQLQIWREKLLAALGNNGQIAIDVIPEVELIIGKQPTVPTLGTNESQNRFNLVFGNFIRAFCSREHPLVIFLDDLQWSDLATLKLMERLIEDTQTQYLLILGAYRDNEVSSGHPLNVTLERLRQKESEIAQITLDTLTISEIAQLIGETLQSPPENVRDLAELVWRKTEGNPFFINEFLQELYGENLLTFHRPSRSWQWDLEAIEAMGFTDNVVELMVGKITKTTRTHSTNIIPRRLFGGRI
jgi:serine/threonine protein kinase